jgi:hypothetical protein
VVPLLDGASVPLQPSAPLPPLAAHDVALALFQVNVVEPPFSTEVGEAEKVLNVAGGAVTFNVAAASVLPPAPLQVNVYV